jgi:hypothetical protein
MIEEYEPLPSIASTIVRAIHQGSPGGEAAFRRRFEEGVRFLAKRRCPDHSAYCIESTINNCIEAIRVGKIQSDKQIPALLRRQLERTLASFPGRSEVALRQMTWLDVPGELDRALSGFTPLQLSILKRFYVEGKDRESICSEFDVSGEVVSLVCLAARIVVRPFLQNSEFAAKKIASSDRLRRFPIATAAS